jgi:hypothetical protein
MMTGYLREAIVPLGFPANNDKPQQWLGERFQHILTGEESGEIEEINKATLAPSWDVLQRITKNLQKFPEESSLQWIPSHQDTRLNVGADKQDGQFQQQSTTLIHQ